MVVSRNENLFDLLSWLQKKQNKKQPLCFELRAEFKEQVPNSTSVPPSAEIYPQPSPVLCMWGTASWCCSSWMVPSLSSLLLHRPAECVTTRSGTDRHLPSFTSAPSTQVFGGLGDLLMPAVTPQSTGGSTAGSTAGSSGTPVATGVAAAPPATPPATKTIGGDLDSSLANLIGGRLQIFLKAIQSFLFKKTKTNKQQKYFNWTCLFFAPFSDLGVKKK